MTKEYIKQQAERKTRDRQFAIDLATKGLEKAMREFRYKIMEIERDYNTFDDPSFVYITVRANDDNRISAK